MFTIHQKLLKKWNQKGLKGRGIRVTYMEVMTKFFGRKYEGENHLGDLGVDSKIILKMTLEK